jgi:membrane protein YdbS with pleckstrin-like domain
MENLNLKKQERIYLKLKRTILSIVFIIIAIAVSIPLLLSPAPIWIYPIAIFAIGLLYLLIFIYQGAHFRHFSYEMNEFGLHIDTGVFWRTKIIVPKNRVQHTDVTQGPLERRYDLAELVVHTAGTRNASIKLPGIKHKTAEELRESLSFDESNDAV